MAENDNILNLFQGLSPDQVNQFRSRIVPALKAIRDEIMSTPQESSTPTEKNLLLGYESESHNAAEGSNSRRQLCHQVESLRL